jgi:hypothetical protein
MEHVVVTGTVCPNEEADYEDNKICIVTEDDDVYQVMQNRLGKNLAQYIDARVKVRGLVKEDYFNDRVISIEDYSLLDE